MTGTPITSHANVLAIAWATHQKTAYVIVALVVALVLSIAAAFFFKQERDEYRILLGRHEDEWFWRSQNPNARHDLEEAKKSVEWLKAEQQKLKEANAHLSEEVSGLKAELGQDQTEPFRSNIP